MRLVILMLLSLVLFSCSPGHKDFLLDDFEGQISGGAQGTVDFGSGAGSVLQVSSDTTIKYSGAQSLKAVFTAVPGGYMWMARGYGLDVPSALGPAEAESINWKKYKAISFYMYGANSKTKVAFDLKDNGNEMWRFMVEDNFQGWKKITCPFSEFFARGDWQPQNADKNAILNFPVKSFQFEPRPDSGTKQGTLYFDCVELLR